MNKILSYSATNKGKTQGCFVGKTMLGNVFERESAGVYGE
jgi:hypothetical protein